MLQTRVIPILLLKGKGLVKTVKFNSPKYIGDPFNAVKIFNEKEVDELLVLDIMATKEKREPDFDLIRGIASECFMPLGYGGGIKKINDIKKLFSIGVEKVVINSQAINDFTLIEEASRIFGDQSIVVCIDVCKNIWGKLLVYDYLTSKPFKIDLITHLKNLQNAGVGEIIINSVDLDGTMKGYDLQCINTLSKELRVPLVICGGAGKIEDFKFARDAGASAVAAGSIFVYHGPHKAVLINYPSHTDLKNIFKLYE
jgi:cyclase